MPNISTTPKYAFDLVPNKEAIRFLENKGLAESFSYKDVWAEEHAFAFTVAKATEIDVLLDVRNAVEQAIANGQTFKSFQKELTPLLQEKGWWGEKEMLDPKTGELMMVQLGSPRRLKTIYRTNMNTARMAGKWERAQRTKDTLPYFIYTLGASKEHRKEHSGFKGIILPIDHPFWKQHFPPNGWGCNCSVRQITEYEAKKLGGVSKNPYIEYENFINDRTGKMYKVPKGVDPSFAHNAGKAREQGIDKAFSDKFGNLPENIAHVVIKDILASPRFSMLKEGKVSGMVPVAVLPNKIAKALIADSPNRAKETMSDSFSTVFFSNFTSQKQRKKHTEIDIVDYGYLQWLLENGEYRKDKRNHLVFVGNNGRNLKAVIKRSDRGEYFLQTIHEVREKQVQNILKKKK